MSNESDTSTKRRRLSIAKPTANRVLPKVWLIAHCETELCAGVASAALLRGDIVIGGLISGKITPQCHRLLTQYPRTFSTIPLDVRIPSQCQQAVEDAIGKHGRVDITLGYACKSYFGALEEFETWHFEDQFESVFYGAVNLIKSSLPGFRSVQSGHIINVTDLAGSLAGMPGLAAVAAANCAVEGYCESLAFEVAPYNIKVTVVEVPHEVGLLTNAVIFANGDHIYKGTVTDRVRNTIASGDIFPLKAFQDAIKGILAIAAIDNPPSKLIAGLEAMNHVKEKLSIISEEMDDFLNTSYAADLDSPKN